MSVPAIVEQRPQDVADDLDYGFDYARAPWLVGGDVLASSSWTVSPDGLTLHDSGFSDTQSVVWCTGGTSGTRYTVTNVITTANNPLRKLSRSFTLPVL